MELAHPPPSLSSFPSNNSNSHSAGVGLGVRPLSASMSSSADPSPHGRTLSAVSNTSALSTGSGVAASPRRPVGGGTAGTLFQGKLYKRGRYNKAFKERWFVISQSGQWMEYHESMDSAQSKGHPLGTIDLALVQRIEAFTVNPNANHDELPPFISWNLKQSEKKVKCPVITG